MHIQVIRNGVLSPKEVAVLALVAGGLTIDAIADTLHRSSSTIRHHVENGRYHAGVKNTHELISYAFAHGLIKALPVFLVVCVLTAFFDVDYDVVRPMRRPVNVVRVQMRRPTERLGSEFS